MKAIKIMMTQMKINSGKDNIITKIIKALVMMIDFNSINTLIDSIHFTMIYSILFLLIFI